MLKGISPPAKSFQFAIKGAYYYKTILMLPNLLSARRDGALVCIPEGHRIIVVGGFNAEVNTAIENVECLS